jgi:hypothetical protein
MKGFLVVLVIAAVAIGAIGFTQGWFKGSTTTTPDKIDVTGTVDKDKWRQDRDAFHKQAEARLKDLDRSMDELKTKSKNATGEAKVQYDEAMTALSKQAAAAREDMRELGSATQERWESVKTRLSASLDDLKTGFERAASRFK